MSKNTSQAQPIPQTGRERRASAKAQAMGSFLSRVLSD